MIKEEIGGKKKEIKRTVWSQEMIKAFKIREKDIIIRSESVEEI